MRPNFIPTPNPFNLATPPDWFLDELAAYDEDARIFASETDGVYRIGRKAKHGPAMMGLLNHPDAKTMRRHGLVPSTSVLPTNVAGQDWAKVLIGLMERDTWGAGGADAAADTLDEWDRQEEERLKRDFEAENDARAGDCYRLIKNLAGERLGMAYRKPHGGRTSLKKLRRTYRPAGAGSGAMWARQRGEARQHPANRRARIVV
jgi:hypothetical protein